MPAVTFTTGGALGKSALRQANERLVLNAIRQNAAVSRADIVRITGLAPSSVTFIVKRLTNDGLVREEKAGSPPRVGRQPTELKLRTGARIAVGVDITLSGARIILGDLNDTITGKKSIPWQPNHGLFFDRVHAAIRSLVEPLAEGQVLGVGVALPGFLDRESGKVVAAENFNWFGVEAGKLLQRRLQLPFYYENGAKLSALAEMWHSERDPKPLRNFVSVTARGGLGTGVIINGQVLQGAYSAASEFGHTIIDPNGRPCACGNRGCWEQYASDLALCRLYAERCGEPDPAGTRFEPEAVIAKARAGDPAASGALEETAYYAGIGFANLIMALNPEAIVVADYLAEAWDLIEEPIWKALRGRVPAYYLSGVRVFPSRHGTDSSLVGAMALVLTRFFSSFEHRSPTGPSNAMLMRS